MNLLFITATAVAAGLIVLMALSTVRRPDRRRERLRDAPTVEGVSELVEQMGYEIDNVRGEAPESVDIEAHHTSSDLEETVLVRWLPPTVGSPGPRTIQAFVEDVQTGGKNRGLLFSSDLLTKEAHRCTEGTPVLAFDPPAIQELRDRLERDELDLEATA